MVSIRSFILSILLLFSTVLFSQAIQEINIDLNVLENVTTYELGTKPFEGNKARFKGIPSNLKNRKYQIRYAELGADTVFVLYGDVSKKERICIVDNDKDNDFSNNYVFRVDKQNNEFVANRPLLTTIKDKKPKLKQNIYLSPSLINSGSNNLSKKDWKKLGYDINISANLFSTGHIEINNKSYTLIIQNILGDASKYQFAVVESSKFNSKKIKEYKLLNQGDSFETDGFKIEPNLLSSTKRILGMKITNIELARKVEQVGIEEGYTIPDLVTSDINNKVISLANYRGSYLLIDFWGTWCEPCLKILPRLANLNKTYPDLKILSVAFELEEKSIYKIPNFVREYEMNWPQVYELMQMPKGFLTFEFQVNKFPTMLLIDPYGVIIHRGGENSIDNLEEKLEKLFARSNR